MDPYDRFPRIIKQIQDLQELEQQTLRAAAIQGEFEVIVFFPPFGAPPRKRPMRWRKPSKQDKPPVQIWAYQARQLIVLRHLPDKIIVERVPLDRIHSFELGEVLLYGWITLEYDDGVETRTTHVDFNTVGLLWIGQFVETLRGQTALATTEPLVPLAPQVRTQFTHLPNKWRFIVSEQARAGGETVSAIAYEPSVAPGFFRRTGREGHLLILTPTRLIKVTEPLEFYPYGKVATWYLRSRIREIHFDETDTGAQFELTFGAHDAPLRIETTRVHSKEWRALADELDEIRALP